MPGANVPLEKLCHEWADKEKVDLKVDFITSNGDEDLLMPPPRRRREPDTTYSAFLPVRAGLCRKPRTGRRRDGDANRAAWSGQRRR